MKYIIRAFSGIFLLFMAVTPVFAQKVRPVLKLTVGNTYYSISNLSSSITQTINGRQVSYTMGMYGKTANKVISVKDTVYNLEITYKVVEMKMQMPGGVSSTYDSANPAADNPFAKVLSAMIDKPFYVTISNNGRVLAVTGADKVTAAIFNNIAIADTAQLRKLKAQFTQSFGEKAFKGNLEQTFSIYPGFKVAKGDKWVINTHLESTMKSDIQTTFQLVDIMPGYYLIHGDGKLTTPDSQGSQINGMPVTYNLSGPIVSDIKVDKVTGWVIESKLKQDVSGDIHVADNPQVPGGMDIPMTVHVDAMTTDN